MPSPIFMEEADTIIDSIYSDATLGGRAYEMYLRETIERGLADVKAGRTKDVNEIRAKYGLPK